MNTNNFFNQFKIASTIIFYAFFSITAIVMIYLFKINGLEVQDIKDLLGLLLPLFGTWVGTVLAYYFGKENFEAASKRYENIIQKLTPDVLDDISIKQIMIDQATMVSKEESVSSGLTVNDLIVFLDSISKSRLPILNNQKIKYIIHKSTLLEAKANGDEVLKLSEFVSNTKYSALLVNFITIEEEEKLEDVRKMMTSKDKCKDAFVCNKGGVLTGWLTDTLIIRYIGQ